MDDDDNGLDKAVLGTGDIRAIERVLLNYALGIDRKDWALLCACFTPDVIVDYGNEAGRRQGRDALMERMISAHEALGPTLHRVTNIVVDADEDSARACSYVDAVLMDKQGETPVLRAVGRYEDRLTRLGGKWRISERVFVPVWMRKGSSST